MRGLRKKHPDHIRNGEPPQLYRHYQEEDGDWTCEACLRVRLIIDPKHTLAEGCMFEDGGVEVARRATSQLGLRAAAGPARDLAIQAEGVADGDPIIDDLDLDMDVEGEDGVVSTPVDTGARADTPVATKEEREGTPLLILKICQIQSI